MMTFAQLKKLMPEGTTDDAIKAQLKIINDEVKALADKEVKGLKDNQVKNLDEIKKLKGNQLPKDFDPEAFSDYTKNKDELAKKQKELADKELEGKGQWEALKLQLNETNNKKIETLSTEKDAVISNYKKALDTELVENVSIKEIEKVKGNSLFLLPHMKDKVKTIQNEDGSFATIVVNENGEQRFGDDATTPFEVKDLVAELQAKPEFAPAFPTQNDGSGNAGGAGGAGSPGVNPWKAETKNITQQAQLNKTNPTLAAQFKKQAGVKDQ